MEFSREVQLEWAHGAKIGKKTRGGRQQENPAGSGRTGRCGIGRGGGNAGPGAGPGAAAAARRGRAGCGRMGRNWGSACSLFCATLAVFGRTIGHEFVAYDDDQYVYENRHVRGGLTPGRDRLGLHPRPLRRTGTR